ncbi:MAG: hypothetical protein IJ228_08745 [Succinivibrio sp.]|nr:hypothetical protein [Succinivibrio sp.]
MPWAKKIHVMQGSSEYFDLYWEEGNLLNGEPALPPSGVGRLSEITLPQWLDNYLFKIRSSSYRPDPRKFSLNLDNDLEDQLIYLGTYFPRSFAESYCVFDNLLRHSFFERLLRYKDKLRIYSLGCGCGGEVVGALQAMRDRAQYSGKIEVTGVDGNESALEIFAQVLQRMGKRQSLSLSVDTKLQIMDDTWQGLDAAPDSGYDLIICSKLINELYATSAMQGSLYLRLAQGLGHALAPEGVLYLADVSNAISLNGRQVYVPVLLNYELQQLSDQDDLVTISPWCCRAGSAHCTGQNCYTQLRVRAHHSQNRDILSKFCYRLLCRSEIAERVRPPVRYLRCNALINESALERDLTGCCPSRVFDPEHKTVDAFNLV